MQIAPWVPGQFRDLSRPVRALRSMDRPMYAQVKARALTSAVWGPYAAAGLAILLLLPALKISAHWPFVHDAPIIRYIGFLMQNGFAPYRDIIDMQMPGSYLADRLVVHTLGTGPAAWWAWDALNGAGITLAMAWIAGQNRRLYGVIAGCLACLAHLSDGPWFLGQRDWTVALLIALSAGCLFHFARRARPAWVGCAFVFAGLAGSIRPPAVLIPVALLLAIERERRLDQRHSHTIASSPARIPMWAVAGSLPALLGVLFFLHSWGAVPAFLNTMHGLMPYYAGLHRVPLTTLAVRAGVCAPLLVLAFLWTLYNGAWRCVQINLLMLCSACGIASYLVQGKGFPYHLYPALPFLCLWVVLEIAPARVLTSASPALPSLRRGGVALVAFVCIAGLLCLSMVAARTYPMNTLNSLEADLNALGGAELTHHVQCLDMTLGSCLNVLYRMHLVQSTGTISDFYLFADRPTPLTKSLQTSFLNQVISAPPKVFVLSNQMWPSDRQGYTSVVNFPQLQALLRNRYVLAREYKQDRGDLAGYRLYVQK